MKTGDGQRVAQPVYRPGKQGHGLLAQLQDALSAAGDRFVERFGEIE